MKTKIENNDKLDQFRQLLQGAFTEQQTEAVIGMLSKLNQMIDEAQAGDSIRIEAAIRKDKRLKIEVESVASKQKSHFNRIVLGACRKAHLGCLRLNKKFNFKKVEQVLYRLLFTNDQEKAEKVKRMKRIAHGIYRGYYSKIQKSRAANSSSPVFAELQETFPNVNMQAVFELFSVSLEDKQFRMSESNVEFIKDILWLSRGKIPDKERAE
ncbi:MAG: hypothetical protein LBF86_08570 [Helicobacteraceae bacterium]|jgi:hypothetical protein|nr:hypothetical protein [Helicobacteraceae bacterium]